MADDGNNGGSANKWLKNLYDSGTHEDPVVQAGLDALSGTDKSAKSLQQIFTAYMDAWTQEFGKRFADVDKRRKDLEKEELEIAQKFQRDIVEFLVHAQPGPLSDLARMVLREKADLLDKLQWKATALNDAVLDAMQEF